ncbi:MAG: DUF86 domain-containing protein [Thermoplasmata archaeon]|nr:DUF86 domain-containing protein [Thermoplasmata archaeon]
MKKDSVVYLRHIMDAINRVEKYTRGILYQNFMENDIVQAAVIREFEIIGEAAKRISEDIRTKYPAIPWRNMAGMRDKLVHDYMGVDMDAVWNTVEKDIPNLKKTIKIAIEMEEGH